MIKPWDGSWDFSFSLCSRRTSCRTCLVFLYESYCKFMLLLVFFHNETIILIILLKIMETFILYSATYNGNLT